MPLKAAISPSAPAPPLKDTDFSSFASLDGMEGVQDDDGTTNQEDKSSNSNDDIPSTLPVSAPRSATSAGPNEFGPIGSPPTAKSPPRLNGLGNGTSPSNDPNILSSSPFSAPGTQTSFYPSSYSRGVPASLGSGLAMRKGWGDVYDAASPTKPAKFAAAGASNRHATTAVVDEEMEDFIPGSLTDLLTPEERSRRMSRSNSGQPPVGLTAAANALKITSTNDGGPDSTVGGMGHRHSRSVPAPSLLGDLKSIWSDQPAGLPASPGHRGTPSTSSALAARFEGLNVNNNDDSANLSMSFGSPSSLSMLSPSNASAAFLPGFHSQYLNAKAKQGQQGALGRGLRNTSNPVYPTNSTNPGASNTNSLATNYLHPNSAGLPSSMQGNSTLHTHIHGGTAHTYRTAPSPFDLTQNLVRPRVGGLSAGLGAQPGVGGAGVGGLGGLNEQDDVITTDHLLRQPHVLSPGSRALQSHAPGQSLPQGLAAGLSRIHALPPAAASPGGPGVSGTPGSFLGGTGASPGVGNAFGSTNHLHHLGPYGDWQSNAASAGGNANSYMRTTMNSGLGVGNAASNGLGGAFGPPPGLPEPPSKMSYSAATVSGAPSAPPGIPNRQQRPVQYDEDELFSMDG
ncbi:hypothetical protein EST38_g4139 [Candolleomyces aberdarensis]|uniref:Uncharacterized protein n=1 Tax=Candolleomyces aberdarensis TaxID=2316362 RepID=A0A4Q2DS29_9AGAR|nr:hypothetical protein EST38_g4139 [Candolleomyces aberdarensis]